MRKVVDGVIYDTEKAEEVDKHSEHYPGDFYHYSETLYRTKKGNWFLDGAGGPASKYATRCGNMSHGDFDIVPLTSEEAQKWLERYGSVSELEKYFSENLVEA